MSTEVDGRLRAPEFLVAEGELRGLAAGAGTRREDGGDSSGIDSSGDEAANARSSESAGEGSCGGAASPDTPSGEVKRLDARAWRSKKSASDSAFVCSLRRASSWAA